MSHFLTQFQLGSLTLIGPSKGGQFISVQVATKFSNMFVWSLASKDKYIDSDYDQNHDDYEKHHEYYNSMLRIQPASIEDQQ